MALTKNLSKRVQELKKTALELGGELLLDEKVFHDKNHLNCLWYGSGQIGAFVYKGFVCSVEVQGDVSLAVLDKRYDDVILSYQKPDVGGAYGIPEVMAVIKDDKTLDKLMDSGRIDFTLNNWVELVVFDENDNYYSLVDSVLDDNVLDAISDLEGFVDLIEELMQEANLDDKLAAAADRAANANQSTGKDMELGDGIAR